MQPSCFVTDGKGELMQTSKNHFEAKVIFNDETIRRMFRTDCSPLAAVLPTTLQQAALLLPARQLLQAAAST